jgi:hypothetical protein
MSLRVLGGGTTGEVRANRELGIGLPSAVRRVELLITFLRCLRRFSAKYLA